MRATSDPLTEAVSKADAIVNGGLALPAFADLKALVRQLKEELAFDRGRKVISRVVARDERSRNSPPDAFTPDQRLWLIQQLALCTYKDEELLPSARFRDALALLNEIGLRARTTTNPETLALGGAVLKRKFQFAGQLDDLQESLALYRAGWERKPTGEPYVQERAYAGVNAAYTLDILAERAHTIARRSCTDSRQAAAYSKEATDLREQILAYLEKHFGQEPKPKPTFWDAVTWAEVYFGLERYGEAEQHLAFAAANLPASRWERETTVRQLVGLARLHHAGVPPEGSDPKTWSPAWRALHAFLGPDAEAASSCYRGKIGLALSGGGFRASLFHIGVLARLAEMDVLRHVEVLSTVSGGSIVGAHYYLEVQRLLETRRDRTPMESGAEPSRATSPNGISRDDYVDIVRRVQCHFMQGVQRNLRMRTLSSLTGNLRMLMTDTYTRSNRIGELYERELYARVDDGRHTEARRMPQLLVRPTDGTISVEGFNPKFSNWQRRAKVPILLLNATSLNSGHNWQFTARWMGEPPGLFEPDIDIDANVRYRRPYYHQIPGSVPDVRLGDAVAASACVPGIFEPLVLKGVYPGRTVRLVDGGVHDNQGVEALLGEGCTMIFCSDASGQMGDLERPSDTIIGVPLRSNSILQDRIREAEFQDLRARVENQALQGLFFVHLKKDLKVAPLNWIGCTDPIPVHDRSMTSYQIDRDLQRLLAAIRTDLDSFSEVEAYALMTSGYLMTDHTVAGLQREHLDAGETGTWGDFDVHAERGEWSFLVLENLMKQPPDSADRRRHDLALQLEAGSGLVFKVWRLVPWLRNVARVGVIALAILLVCFVFAVWDLALPALEWDVTVGHVVVVLSLALLTTVRPILKWMTPQSAVRGWLMKATVAFVGFVASNIHLLIFDRLYLARGRIDRLMNLK